MTLRNYIDHFHDLLNVVLPMIRSRAMIRLIPATQTHLFPRVTEAMFRCRAQTFSERLGREVVVTDGYERDRFDNENPLYLVSVDPRSGEYRGSLRLLPTTGPNMLRNVFPALLKDDETIESATIWECSRICVAEKEGQHGRKRRGVSNVLAELLVGIGDVARLAGLTQIVAVFDSRMFRILEAAGCKPDILGTPRRIGGTMSYAGLFNMNEAFQRAVRDGLGIEGPVVVTEIEEPVAA
jgi:N-acyl-L-homoserine lactone synthetase